jgi:hypothetical protein
MISFLHVNTAPLTLSPDEVFARYEKIAEPYGGQPDIVMVSRKEHLPAACFNSLGRFAREGCFDWVDSAQFATLPLAVREGFARCIGTLVMCVDSEAQVSERTYERLVAGAKYPVKSAGTTFVADGYGLDGEELGIKRYTGPLAFPFTIRRAAIEEAGLLPPVCGESVAAQLAAYTMSLNAAGWWIAGSRA